MQTLTVVNIEQKTTSGGKPYQRIESNGNPKWFSIFEPPFLSPDQQNTAVNFELMQKGKYWNGKVVGGQPQQQPQQPAQSNNSTEDAEGKVRHGVVCAAIQAGSLPCQTYEDALMHTKFIMTGQVPGGQDTLPGDDIPY